MKLSTKSAATAILCAATGALCPLFSAAPSWQDPYTGEDATGEDVIALFEFSPGQESEDSSGHGHIYTGEDATGEDVIALFEFSPGQESEDSSGHGHILSLHGQSTFSNDGKFGGGLRIPSVEGNSRQGATVANHPSFSPEGAFAVDMWVRPEGEGAEHSIVHLLDTMAISYDHKDPDEECKTGFMLQLERKGEQSRLLASLGFGRGEELAQYASKLFDLEQGKWNHIAFSYDGKGRGRFFLNGKNVGESRIADRSAIHPSTWNLAIGERGISTFTPFVGSLDQVRILNREFSPGMISLAQNSLRTSFLRMEDAALHFTLTNQTGRALENLRIAIRVDGQEETVLSQPSIGPDGTHSFAWDLNTTLRPGEYRVMVQVTSEGKALPGGTQEFPVTIVARPLPVSMPVVMWNGGDFTFGFTHMVGYFSLFNLEPTIWEKGHPLDVDPLQSHADLLNESLTRNMSLYMDPSPGRMWKRHSDLAPEFLRVNREGKPYEDINVSGLFPRVQEFAYNVGATIARSYEDFPAWQASLLHTEIRDHTEVSFHEIERNAFRAFAGYDIPEKITSKNGVHYRQIENFPKDRVVADDDPILTFYRWFWTKGDGWNALNSALHRGLKSTGREDLWTWFDPAVRAPSIYGSGGEVDVIANWTYPYPDPIKIGQATDELFAMARGAAHDQDVMSMTQVIWYRYDTAPEGETGVDGYQADWEKEHPDAKLISTSPDCLREAFWSKISRPITGIMYHGWGSLVDTGEKGSYRFTHPEPANVLRELIQDVVQPLGPTLVQVPDPVSDVGMLQSFTSQMFAGRGTRGWSRGWGADSHLVLQYAQLQPRILYEEAILQEGLDDFKVLVLTDCDVLPESVVRAVRDFQIGGGIVIGDENLCPAIFPDIVMARYERSKRGAEDKDALMAKAKELRRQLDGFYQRRTDSDNPEVITRLRRFGNTDYLFAVNDHREYGQYVGHHRRVMEVGKPSRAELFLDRQNGHVYDLLKGGKIETRSGATGIRFDAEFAPGGGGLWMVTERPISEVRVSGPESVKTSGTVDLAISVLDDQGEAVGAVVPLHVDIIAPDGQSAEFSGHYGAKDGRLDLKLTLAPNDPRGDWKVVVRDLASRLQTTHRFQVE